MTRDTDRESARRKLERLARDSADAVSFWRQATDVLRVVVPFDFHPCWFLVDPSTLLVTGHVNEGLSETPKEIAQAWYAEGDVNSPADLASVRGGATTVAVATGGDVVSSWRWRHLLEPNGFDDSLDAVFRAGGTIWGAVNLLHSSESRPYSSEDVRFVSRLSSVLAEGTRLGQMRSEAASRQSGNSPAVLIVSAELGAVTMTENAEGWLSDMPDIGAFRPDRLPVPVQVVALRALRSADGEASAIVRTVSGQWVRIVGSRLTGTSQAAMVLESATPQQLAPVRLAAYELTAREHEVVDLILQGRSTREIANALFISEYTVQDRLKAIFEKVGVRSRRELVALIHKNDFQPRIEVNDARVRSGQPIQR